LCAFLQLWAIQALLPTRAAFFGATEAAVSLTVSATTLAVTITAPVIGVLADTLGRRRIIVVALFLLVVPTALIGAAQSVDQIVALRFLQGLLLPPVFAVAVAYIGDEFPHARIAAVTATYTTGSVLGGFLGRFLAGWIGDFGGWRVAFFVLAALSLAGAIVVAATLPREQRFVRVGGLVPSLNMTARHFRDPRLTATFAVGFGVLFSFVTLFTYINFYLAAPPFNLSSGWLGSLFAAYAFGLFTTPMTGPLAARLGRRGLVLAALGTWGLGTLLTLVPHLVPIFVGLVVCACSGFFLSGGIDRVCGRDGDPGALVGRRPLCHILLSRGYRRRRDRRSGLARRRLARLRGAGLGNAVCEGGLHPALLARSDRGTRASREQLIRPICSLHSTRGKGCRQ